jgi:hypothetical protein
MGCSSFIVRMNMPLEAKRGQQSCRSSPTRRRSTASGTEAELAGEEKGAEAATSSGAEKHNQRGGADDLARQHASSTGCGGGRAPDGDGEARGSNHRHWSSGQQPSPLELGGRHVLGNRWRRLLKASTLHHVWPMRPLSHSAHARGEAVGDPP